MLNALIVEDEPFARADLEELLLKYGGIHVAAETESVDEAIRTLSQTQPDSNQCPFDVVFLDIHLRGGSGFDLLPHLPVALPVIFVTAHDDYAIRAFEVNALDYLLKPVSSERLALAISRIQSKKTAKMGDTSAPISSLEYSDRILISTEKNRCIVAVSQICAIASIGGNYTKLHLKDGRRLLSRTTIKEWESRLPAAQFIRIHRATMVNRTRIVEIRSLDGQGTVRVEKHPDEFPVSRRMAPRLNRG